jgi:carbon monoxide dehydrogenase subunit G
MAGRFGATVVIDRPIDEVFAFLADGGNDKKFSPRVLEITKTTDGPPGVGTVFASTVKDAGVTTRREFKLTEFEPSTRIRWTETSKNLIVVPEGGYDLAPAGAGTQLTFFNEMEGRGIGALLARFALSSARKGADDFAQRIKAAVEAS